MTGKELYEEAMAQFDQTCDWNLLDAEEKDFWEAQAEDV